MFRRKQHVFYDCKHICILAFGYVLSQAQIVVMVMVMVLNGLCDEELKAISV